jgi:RNA 2',3'-cyclic 3'-phosphodiesterase
MVNGMRTFIAIPLPEKCREMLGEMQRKLRAAEAEVRWTPIPSIHLTLKFLGEIDPAVVPRIAQSLRSVSKLQTALNLRMKGLGCFPHQRNPRVVWCAIQGDTEQLLHLQEGVERVCAEYGLAPEDRPFSPHLTLGRVKGKRNLQPLIECIKIGSSLECSFAAARFNIYQSVLKPQGAVYTVLETMPFVA